jgi:hypothetical protein
MQISISNVIGGLNSSISYVKKLIKAFKARVLSYPNSILEAEACLDTTLTELNDIGLLKKASLIVTPNAYNEGVLYDVVPNTTLGDMNVVRATTGTRVNSLGLVEVVPRNLLTYSNTFTNAVWGNAGYGNIATVIANDIISPDGLMNGSKITFSAGVTQARLIQSTSVINGGIYQASIFVKYGNKNTIDFYCDAAITGLFATFNFTTKVLTPYGVTNPIVTELENGWFRLQYTYTAPSATSQIGFISNIGADGFVYAYGGQVDNGSTATEYFPTTTRLNIPRIDYSNGSCPSILVEPQRTNVLTYSNNLNNGVWYLGNVTKTNGQVSPTSTNNEGWLLNKTATGVDGVVFNGFGISTLSIYTFSWYILKDNNTSRFPEFYLRLNNGEREQYVQLNTKTGALGVRIATSGCTRSITSSPDGLWWRLTLTNPAPSTNGGDNRHGVRPAAGTTLGVYNINATGSVIVYGAQTEAGTYATSYIPTTSSAAVTRNADIISKTGISSLIGQTEGTLFCDVNLNSRVSFSYLALSTDLTTTSNYLGIAFLANAIAFESVVGAALQANISHSNSSTGRFKIAAAYKANDFVLYINGIQIGTDTNGTVPACSQLGLNAFNTAQALNYNSVQVYKTKLSNTELQSLTTL